MKISSFTPTSEASVPQEPAKLTPRLQPRLPSTSKTTSLYEGPVADLLSLQRTNFRAFYRQVKSLQVEDIKDKWELEDELRNLQARWNAIDTLHLQIDNALQGSDIQYENEFNDIENSYRSIKQALNIKLASTVHLVQSTPQIEIPTFTGAYTQWPTFYDLYLESIHNNNILSKTQKMQHLKGKLRGDAERLIQHLQITAENYDTAWELLTHRYNNPQLLFTKNIEIFLNQPICSKQSAYEIRRLFDTSMECIHAIQNLGIEISTWDPILVHIISQKLDSETYSDYKQARKMPRELPSLSELMNFLENKFNALEPINKHQRSSLITTPNKPIQHKTSNNKMYHHYNQHPSQRYGKQPHKEFQAIATSISSCPICNQTHFLYKCSKFLNYSAYERLMTVIKLKYCENCLYSHNVNQCISKKTCKVCQNNHNTMLHDAYTNMKPKQLSMSNQLEAGGSMNVPTVPVTQKQQFAHSYDSKQQHSVNHVASDNEEILLTTLSLNVKSINGTYIRLRALLDQGSQISLISENAAQLLGLPRQRFHASVSGIGNGSKAGKGIVTLECQSIYEDFEFSTQALIIQHVINNLPNSSFKRQSWSHLQNINLADPQYNISMPIDMLLDASVYSEIIMNGLIKGPNMAPIAQQTRLGWILSGNVTTFKCHVVINNLSELSQYWELEGINDSKAELTQDEQHCEQLYQTTTKRLHNGKYEVAIPMKPGFEQNLGQSKSKAIAQFYNLESKMSKNKQFAERYKSFIQEYEQQGHMSPVTKHDESSCYLPHHGVIKSDSTTTKLRTVFNASAKTTSGFSLNDLMYRGPNLQKDLQHLILVWCQHKYVITADIEKMFRQIAIRESDQQLQRIVWRNSPEEHLREYQLTTVP